MKACVRFAPMIGSREGELSGDDAGLEPDADDEEGKGGGEP